MKYYIYNSFSRKFLCGGHAGFDWTPCLQKAKDISLNEISQYRLFYGERIVDENEAQVILAMET